MQYYSSMTLADYINTNWMELPKELVDLFEKEWERYIDQEDDIQGWRENYHDLSDKVERTTRDMTRTLDQFVNHEISKALMIEILRDEISDLDYAL